MKHLTTYLSFLILVFFLSCGGSKTETNEFSEQKSNDTLLSFNKQIFTIAASSDSVIIGEKGTKIKLLAGSLQNPMGEIYSGSVSIELIEFYDLSEMVINNLSTETTDGKLLSTGGMVYVNFLDSINSQLSLIDGKGYELWFKKSDTLDKREMHLFKGEWDKEDSPCLKWEKSEDTLILSDQVWGLKDDVLSNNNLAKGTVDYFIFNSTQIGWINCDAFVKYEQMDLLTKVSIQEQTKAAYRLIDKKTKSIGVLYQERKNGKYEFNMVQTGNQYYLFSFYKKDGYYYYNLTDFVAKKEGNEITPKFEKTDLAGLKVQAEKLDD
ncbi:MAG TPA: KH domain-containing protein [Flavobacteriales bacterium]|nr:KH domain-containing protein [Flavobacteriales bacterium]